jgi:hypothetical protein
MIECIGSPNKERQEDDFYATHPQCVRDLIKKENLINCKFPILENSVGMGHIAEQLKKAGNQIFTIDIKNRGYPLSICGDFLKLNHLEILEKYKFDCAVYNPPFKLLKEFILKTFNFTNIQYVFCRLQALEGISRFNEIYSKKWLKKVYIYSKRTTCAKDGKDEMFGKSNSMCFCWLVLDINNIGPPIIEWL